jgi:hypothetical protein
MLLFELKFESKREMWGLKKEGVVLKWVRGGVRVYRQRLILKTILSSLQYNEIAEFKNEVISFWVLRPKRPLEAGITTNSTALQNMEESSFCELGAVINHTR